MRLRRTLAVGAVAAAAIVATTAFAFPSTPVDRAQPLPALTAPALAARYAADSRLIAHAARAAGRSRPGGRGRRQPGPGQPGGHSRARLRHVADDVRLPGLGLPRRRRPGPR